MVFTVRSVQEDEFNSNESHDIETSLVLLDEYLYSGIRHGCQRQETPLINYIKIIRIPRAGTLPTLPCA